jgi:hypothetical protein
MPSLDYRGGVYDGEIKEGIPHGKGILTYSSQHVYDGEWVNGCSHGKGTAYGVITTGSRKGTFRYEGYWLDDMMAGRGKFTWPNGDVYDGDWSNDKPNGMGIYTFKDSGARYIGMMKDGKRHGYGTYIFKDNSKYEGEWRHDSRCGKGVEIFANSNKYEGYWFRDQKHGPGLCQIHMSNIPISPTTPTTPNSKENRLSKALKRLSLKRPSPSTSGRSASQSGSKIMQEAGLKFVEYVPYYQVWDNGKKVSEREIQAHDDPPNLDAPVEVALECGYESAKNASTNVN